MMRDHGVALPKPRLSESYLVERPSKAFPCGHSGLARRPSRCWCSTQAPRCEPARASRAWHFACRPVLPVPPLSRALCLPCLAAHFYLANPGHRTRVASAAEFCGPETMCGRPACDLMSEHVNFGITYPFPIHLFDEREPNLCVHGRLESTFGEVEMLGADQRTSPRSSSESLPSCTA